jgi:GT2 family glycosyltransferase
MAIKVVELELTDPAISLAEIDPIVYSSIQCLVRYRGVPLGYAWFKTYPGIKPPGGAELRTQLTYQVSIEWMREQFKKGLQLQPELHAKTVLPLITVAVVTRDRASSLERLLNSLLKLKYPQELLDILIIDNAPSNESTRRVVANFPTFRYLIEERPGLSWGRNRAIAEARGEILVFTDDDVEVDPAWVAAFARQFSNPAVMAVTGLVAPAERDTEAQNFFEEMGGFGKGFQRTYFAMPFQMEYPYFPLGAGAFGTGANMAFRNTVFEKVGRFDEALGVGTPAKGSEDLDMFYRIIRAGFLLVYQPEAIVWHYHRRSFEELEKQSQGVIFCFYTKVFVKDPPMRGKTVLFMLYSFWTYYLSNILQYKGQRRRIMWLRVTNALMNPVHYYQSLNHKQKIIKKYGNQTG